MCTLASSKMLPQLSFYLTMHFYTAANAIHTIVHKQHIQSSCYPLMTQCYSAIGELLVLFVCSCLFSRCCVILCNGPEGIATICSYAVQWLLRTAKILTTAPKVLCKWHSFYYDSSIVCCNKSALLGWKVNVCSICWRKLLVIAYQLENYHYASNMLP